MDAHPPPTRAQLEARIASLAAALQAERARGDALEAALAEARAAAAAVQVKVSVCSVL